MKTSHIKLVRYTFSGTSFFFISSVLIAGKIDGFHAIGFALTGRTPIVGDILNLGSAHKISWLVPKPIHKLPVEKIYLSLVVSIDGLMDIPTEASQTELRLVVHAFAIDVEKHREDCLVQDGLFATNRPFSDQSAGFWQRSGHGRLEFILGAVKLRLEEDILIEITVERPDRIFDSARPRLKLFYDDHPSGGINRYLIGLLPDIGLYGSLSLLLILACLACTRPDPPGNPIWP